MEELLKKLEEPIVESVDKNLDGISPIKKQAKNDQNPKVMEYYE